MKFTTCLLFLIGLFFTVPIAAQIKYAVATETNLKAAWDTSVVEHWFVKGKYPESSEALVRKANIALSKLSPEDVSGYITYRMIISTEGQPEGWELLQTDNHYQSIQFSKALVDGLYFFVKDLKGWRKGVYNKRSVRYTTYLSFKIRNGHVVEVSP